MGKVKDITGQRFGRLVVVGLAGRSGGERMLWKVRCDCGIERVVLGKNLCNGRVVSCGCYRREGIVKRSTKHGNSRRGRVTSEYCVWADMVGRCKNVNNSKDYKDYGGRGIRVCDRWHDFRNFLEDMGPRPTPQHSIDRKDNNGNYEPSNCRWATREEQAYNKRNNRMVTFRGETKCVSEWARKLGLSRSSLIERLEGWSLERELTELRHANMGRQIVLCPLD